MNQAKAKLTVERETFPIRGSFRIARGAKTHAEVIVCKVSSDGILGRGECVPYGRYGETLDGVTQTIEKQTNANTIEGLRQKLEGMKAGAARNAIDCALWDWQAKKDKKRVEEIICKNHARPVETAFTLSLDSPDRMADAARAASQRSIIKIKLGGDQDIACMHAVAANAPNSRLIIDANEGWTVERLPRLMQEAAHHKAALIEQPLPVDQDAILKDIPHPVPICADESAHTTADLEALTGKYDFVNIKLDKAGGLTEALRMREKAHDLGFGIMIGCMVGTSLAMAPAVLLAQDADFVDLDGPLLLEQDRSPNLHYYGSTVSAPEAALWG